MAQAGGAQSALPNALTEGFQVAFLVGAGVRGRRRDPRGDADLQPRSREHAEAAQRGEVAPAAAAA